MDSTLLAPAPMGHTKQYVFVDEYNRHKRLKVMRACDGCRKRKIRCDGALQNGPWPCGACLRLKLKCVPPTLDPDDEQQASATYPSQGRFSFHTEILGNDNGTITPDSTAAASRHVQDWAASVAAPQVLSPSTSWSQMSDNHPYTSPFTGQKLSPHLSPGYSTDEQHVSVPGAVPQFRAAPSLLRSQTEASGSSGGDPQEVNATVRELSEHMGDLSIETTSVAPYIANEKKTLAETPAVEEPEVTLPPSVGTDSTVRIPPEMMPSDDRAMDYFGYFFNYVHPYVPVLNRQAFYDQWRSARHSISPLLLEGLFACVAVYIEEPLEVKRWLALAARHEESFKDVPRLSTIQALILLTKAREAYPKRGYYYRSWMAVKYMTAMAFDLGLHEHYDQHQLERCTLPQNDCMIRTRLWQTLFVLENVIGAPQGRTDFGVELETIDFTVPVAASGEDAFEYQTSRSFTYMAQVQKNIKETNKLWQSMKRLRKDWALDPSFVRHNEDIELWLKQLPNDIQLQYTGDGGPPWLNNDHFVAYIHAYHHLVVIMHHRPQLQALLEKRDPGFKVHLDICLRSAAMICRLEEALIRDFGLHGLQFMLRGIGFTIYCVLTCTMLHLAAITSPDPTWNTQARNYFTRHMRVLENCTSSATLEMQAQIQALREAFSVDTHRPFELKPTLGLRSPALEKQATPPEIRSAVSAPMHASSSWNQLHDATSSKTLSPASEYGPALGRVQTHSHTYPPQTATGFGGYQVHSQGGYSPHSLPQVTSAPQTSFPLEPVPNNEHQPTPVWDPSGIFQQWNSAFGQQQTSPNNMPLPRVHAPTSHASQNPSPTSHPSVYQHQQVSPGAAAVMPETAAIAVPTVTPIMWQDAFTTAYVSGHGNKRYRQEDQGLYDEYAKRRG